MCFMLQLSLSGRTCRVRVYLLKGSKDSWVSLKIAVHSTLTEPEPVVSLLKTSGALCPHFLKSASCCWSRCDRTWMQLSVPAASTQQNSRHTFPSDSLSRKWWRTCCCEPSHWAPQFPNLPWGQTKGFSGARPPRTEPRRPKKKALTQLVFPPLYGVTQRRRGAGAVEGANFQMVRGIGEKERDPRLRGPEQIPGLFSWGFA